MTPTPDDLPAPGLAPRPAPADAAPPAHAAPEGDLPTTSPRVAHRLLELCIALGTPRDIGDVLAVILDATTDLLDCGRASILLYDTSARQLRFVAATSQETEALARIPVPLYGSLAGTIFRENRPVVAADVQRDERHFGVPAEAAGYRPRAIAGVPMCIDGVPVGVLEALDPYEGAFSDAHVSVLMAVSAQAAVAVHAARQRHALERAHARVAELDRLKGRLMGLASHEIRAPLGAVQAAAERLRAGVGPAADEAVNEILASAMRIETLVRSVAEVGALPAPEAPLDREAVVLQGVLREASHDAHEAVRLVLDLPSDPVVVSSHPRRLRLALTHLVGQAARAAAAHAPGGDAAEVTVRAAVVGGDAVVEVRNTTEALGPAPDDDEAGLDVVVARVLVERDGGTVGASADGTLHVRLPLFVGPAAR